MLRSYAPVSIKRGVNLQLAQSILARILLIHFRISNCPVLNMNIQRQVCLPGSIIIHLLPGVHHPQVAARLLAQTELRRGWKILDVACGTGLVTFPAAEAVGAEGSISGIEISPGMLRQVSIKYQIQEVKDGV